jgi:hypothetical protein
MRPHIDSEHELLLLLLYAEFPFFSRLVKGHAELGHSGSPRPRSETAVDRFVRTGFVRARKRRSDDVIDFRRVCPLGRRDPKDTYTHESGVVVSSFRTRTQALFSFITSWDYPAAFYERLPRHWPDLSFFCSVNEDMGSFGGVIAVVGGQVHNLVHDYDVDYDRRQHARDVRALLKRWEAHAFGGRDWKLVALAAWEHRYMPFDAQFDDLFWFFFRTREEMAAFRNRYRTRYVMRPVNGQWQRTKLRRPGSAAG